MPHSIAAPSNAGPAAVEAATSSPPEESTISPLVPRSMKSVAPGRPSISAAAIPAVMSEPTNAPAAGGTSRSSEGKVDMPSACAGSTAPPTGAPS